MAGPTGQGKHNPFEFGGELRAAHLVDRDEEVNLVVRTVENTGKLFLIGPRRYGKTSILARAEAELERQGGVVSGFARAGFTVKDDGVLRLLEVSEEVPYNVQQLANLAWELLREAGGGTLTSMFVDHALARLIARESPTYAQLWNSLTRFQKIALKAVIIERGTNLRSAATLSRYAIASASMTKMLHSLDAKGVIREEENVGAIRYRLEDPFLGAWLLAAQDG